MNLKEAFKIRKKDAESNEVIITIGNHLATKRIFQSVEEATKEQLEAFENAVLGVQAIRKGVKTARKTAGIYNQYYRQMNSGSKK